jgi:type IV secretory pathway VirB6-like protein
MGMSYTDSIMQTDQAVQNLLSGFIEKTYAFIGDAFRTPLLICLLIYLIFVGYGIINGWFQLAWKEFSLAITKLVGVSALMFNWLFFQTVLVKVLVDGSAVLVHALTAHVFAQSTIALSGSTESVSQGLLIEIANVGLWVWKMASFTSPLPILLGIVLWLCGLGVIIYGMIQILISKIILTLLLAAAPIVLVFALYRSSSKVAVSWLQLLVSNFLALVLVTISLNLSFYLLHKLFDALYQAGSSKMTVLQLIPIVITSVLSFSMIRRCVSAAFHMGAQLAIRAESSGMQLGAVSAALKSTLRFAK